MPDHELSSVLEAVRACTRCVADLPLGPKPIIQASASARILIIGQAPGTKAHESGCPWNDQSGNRLREWTGLAEAEFYDESKVAIVPAGLCYPGAIPGGGDKPPVPACAPLWHARILPLLTNVWLTLLVGLHAQKLYLKGGRSLTELVRQHPQSSPVIPLPHPSWRGVGWMRKNAWFESESLPMLRKRIEEALR
ncbi:uracil-DNA glycosylase family protein [Arsenicitalea aurantiaca]|uniref:Uracil-DNA glycosylase family protein n=1 Tax=Arsenicitalea aurantiaca TaxID=1783274 RepID=A0A433X359_9HYPH|nr:uracil-DNA glycosylase family protein [Arsenicitalea aurantiaca]RUT28505.1 uracil-DNA glycosylase family protein [Arsenicitalea aurantiaca]